MDHDDAEGRCVCHRGVWQYQVVPALHSDDGVALLPGHDLIGWCGGQGVLPIGPGERADQLAPRVWASAPRVVWQDRPPCRHVLRRPDYVPRRPGLLKLSDLE